MTGVCPHAMGEHSAQIRRLLDDYGYAKAESILNEWNYVKNWSDDFPYSCVTISDAKGGAFVAAAISDCQDAPVDMLMYYDARPGTVFNGLFDLYTFKPRPAYYALFDWSLLRDLGTQVKTTVTRASLEELSEKCKTKQYKEWYLPTEMPDNIKYESVTAVAAKGADGRMGLLLARFNDDDNITAAECVTLRLANGAKFPATVRTYMTDSTERNTLCRHVAEPDGSLVLRLESNAFVYVEW